MPEFVLPDAGYVRVGREDIRRLAKHLGLTVTDFEKRHIVEVTKKGEKTHQGGLQVLPVSDRRQNVRRV